MKQVKIRGFSLMEVLVAVGIIAILASITIVSLSSTREKSRDEQRVSDLGQVQLALKLYAAKNGGYPYYPDGVEIGTGAPIDEMIEQTIPSLPEPPSGGSYWYDSAFECGGFVIPVVYTTMENSKNGNYARICDSVTEADIVQGEGVFALASEKFLFTGGIGGGMGVGWPPADPDVPGCTDTTADNYDADATEDNGSCYWSGCTDVRAENYDSTATVDDGSCIIRGCTNPNAANYDSAANVDNGSCVFAGCTDPGANNYDANAEISDGSCNYGSISAGSDASDDGLYIVILE